MFGSTILDTAIGLAFVFLLLSLIATALREALEVWLKSRAAHLERGIRALLHDPEGTGLARAFYGHPLVRSLYGASAPGDRPSYIPARNFALTLVDLVVRGSAVDDPAAANGATPPITLDAVRLAVGRIQNPPVQRAILTAVDTAAIPEAVASASSVPSSTATFSSSTRVVGFAHRVYTKPGGISCPSRAPSSAVS